MASLYHPCDRRTIYLLTFYQTNVLIVLSLYKSESESLFSISKHKNNIHKYDAMIIIIRIRPGLAFFKSYGQHYTKHIINSGNLCNTCMHLTVFMIICDIYIRNNYKMSIVDTKCYSCALC